MFQSSRSPQLVLRIGLALVFLWFGIDKFLMPQYWVDSWLPQAVSHAVVAIHLVPKDFIFFVGIFEVLVAVSLASGFFMRYFSLAAILVLAVITAFHGLNESSIRDIGLASGLVALVIWPERTYI